MFTCWDGPAPQIDRHGSRAAQSSAGGDEAYPESVLPRSVRRRLAVEAGATLSWRRCVGNGGRVIGIDRFGASGTGAEVLARFGFTAEHVAREAGELLKSTG